MYTRFCAVVEISLLRMFRCENAFKNTVDRNGTRVLL